MMMETWTHISLEKKKFVENQKMQQYDDNKKHLFILKTGDASLRFESLLCEGSIKEKYLLVKS